MAKPKPPAWLTTAFAEGVVELAPPRPAPAYPGALGRCWLAQFDERRRPCEGRFERAHLISRQRVENALWALLPEDGADFSIYGASFGMRSAGIPAVLDRFIFEGRADLILLAAWDPRNGVVACEHHHRRFDLHLTPPLTLRYEHLPTHAIHFAFDWGIESQLDRFPSEI
jgi:hypothetical protein